MRAIDADALMKEFSDRVKQSNDSDYVEPPTWNDAVSLVGSAPTIESERKTGKWSAPERQKSEVFFCSECGGRTYYPWSGSRKDKRPNVCRYNYCPNCGVKMEEQECMN